MHECDESCWPCVVCYRQTGETVCQEVCPHADWRTADTPEAEAERTAFETKEGQ